MGIARKKFRFGWSIIRACMYGRLELSGGTTNIPIST
jgi:hypothetical protein